MKFCLLHQGIAVLLFVCSGSSTYSFQPTSLIINNKKYKSSCIVTSNGLNNRRNKVSTNNLKMGMTTPCLDVPSLVLSSSSSALPSISTITSPIGSLTVLALVILIHELGHFLAARSFNINVREFSVGVGPKVFGFKRNVVTGKIEVGKNQESDETNDVNKQDVSNNYDVIEFNLRAIPLGGYVRFPENYNTTLEYQLEVQADEKREEINRIIQENRNKNKEMNNGLVASVSNVFQRYTNGEKRKDERLLALQIMADELDKKSKMTSLSPSSPWWNNIFQSKKIKKEQDQPTIIIEEDGTVSTPPIAYYDNPDLLQNRGWAQRAVVLAGGVVFNIILAFSLYFGELTIGGGMPRPSFDRGAIVSSIPRTGGPSAGLLNKGDIILAYNGQQLSEDSPSIYKSQEAISNFIGKIRETTPGDVLHLSVMDAKTKSISEIDIKPEPMTENDPNSPLSIGVMIGPNFKGQEVVKASSVGNAISIASSEVYESASETARSILTYLGTILQGGKTSGQSLSGPIGVIKAGSDIVSTNDVSAVIGFMAAISINLAVVNSLPLPALDGGQMIFVLAEAVTGRKVDQRLQESINSAALLFLLIVTFSTAVGDISKIAIK